MSADHITYLVLAGSALLWPLVKLLAQVVYKRFESRLPANINAAIKDYATMAVRSVEQMSTSQSFARHATHNNRDIKSDVKKEMAVDTIRGLLKAAKLPCPDSGVLSSAIEEAVYLLNREQRR